MIRVVKPATLFPVLFLIMQSTFAQVQTSVPDLLSQKFLRYCESVPREEIFVHSDREEYVSGEDMWFNIYLFDRQSLKPSLNSKIVYFELLNPENRPVIQKRIRIEEGFGPGQVVLPDSLSTGKYTIRAYTSWMKNFLPYNCFMKDIKVYNAFSTKEFKEKEKISDNLKGVSVSEISMRAGNTGVTMKVNNFKPVLLEIIVNTGPEYLSQNSNLFYLFIQTRGKINLVLSERIAGESTTITVLKSLLTPGINQITLFDSKGIPVSERFIYTLEAAKTEPTLNSSDSCNTRSKLSLEIDLGSGVLHSKIPANLSLSVAPMANRKDNIDLEDYVIFGSEFGLVPYNALDGRRIDDLSAEEIDNLLLQVRSNWIDWENILSNDSTVFKYPAEKDDHYILGKLITPNLQTTVSDEFLVMSTPGKKAGFQYARTDKEGNFSFRIHIDESLKDLIIQPDDITKNFKINIESSFSNQFLSSSILADSIRREVPSYISEWGENYQVKKIYGSSSIGDPLVPILIPPEPKRFYGKPGIELIMDDYIKLPVMQEVFFELIPGVFMKTRKSIYEISIADPVDGRVYATLPGLMIDGVIINDPGLIGNMDPELVEKIDVIKERYIVGDYIFYGIVNIITRSGDFGLITLPGYAVRIPYRVTEPVWSFISPDYSSAEMKNNRIPDFRNTLYWNPSIKPGKDGKATIEFWTSDIAQEYEVNIQGITPDGRMVSVRKTIKVK
jgi:hypothetical protein